MPLNRPSQINLSTTFCLIFLAARRDAMNTAVCEAVENFAPADIECIGGGCSGDMNFWLPQSGRLVCAAVDFAKFDLMRDFYFHDHW